MNIIRLFSTSLKSVANSELARLRKKTGFSLVNCRNALKQCDNDVAKAEEWLMNEAKRLGWEKAVKYQNRIAPEGLIAVAQTNNKIVMAEVNCETDFVARNEKFVSLCQMVARTCLSHKIVELNKNTKKVLLTDELVGLETPEKEKLDDYIVKRIAEFGEKIVVKRALFYEADKNVEVNFDVHPAIKDGREICTGKYGAFVAYTKLSGGVKDDSDINLAVNLCRHIIALNPKKIGSAEDPPSSVDLNEVETDSSKSEYDSNMDETDLSDIPRASEELLLRQEFIVTSDKTVGEVLNEHGINIIDFHRFQCGEDTDIAPVSDENLGPDAEGDMKVTRAEGN